VSVRKDKLLFKKEIIDDGDKNVVFSFELLDINKFFNIDCTCHNWSSDLMCVLKSLSGVTRKQFESDTHLRNGTYRIHYHKNAKPPIPFPVKINLSEVEQIRFGASKGGIHGFMIENVFYIVWLDPLHNMYPSERHGGLKEIKPPDTCCGWHDEELRRLTEENKEYCEMLG